MVWPSLPSASRTPSPSQAETLFPLNPPSPEPSFPSPPQPPSTCCLCGCDSLSSLYQWNHTAHAFLCLVYVTEHHVLRGHPHVVCVRIASLFIAKECPFVPIDHALFIRLLTTVNNAAVSSAFFWTQPSSAHGLSRSRWEGLGMASGPWLTAPARKHNHP